MKITCFFVPALWVLGCSALDGTISRACPTDPADPLYDSPGAQACRALHAGSDQAAAPEACPGVCINNAPAGFDGPRPVWIGPTPDAPTACPGDVGAFSAREVFDLDAPALKCPECVCGPVEGSCSPTPGQILIRGASCSEPIAYTTPFYAPEGWDGSCNNAGALPADAACPGGLCAVSLYVSALPDPVETCAPLLLPTPHARTFDHFWEQTVLSCGASPPAAPWTCGNAAKQCAYPLPPGWRHCVRAEGQRECPAESAYVEHFEVFPPDAIEEGRGCSPCTCGASGGSCFGSFRLYTDQACGLDPLIALPWDNDSILCQDFHPPGVSIGAKEIADLQYVPGECKASGGFAFGEAKPKLAVVATWCCTAPVEAPDR